MANKLVMMMSSRTIRRDSIVLLICLIVVGTVGAIPRWFTEKTALSILISFTAIPFLFLIWNYFSVTFLIYITLLFGLYDIFGKFPILVYPVNIYLGDGILIFLLVLFLKMLITNQFGLIKSPISGLLIINLVVGLVVLGISYAFFDISFANMFGAFRRYYVYPLSSFVAIFYVNTTRINLTKLKKSLYIVFPFIIGLVIFRMVTNQSWWGEYYEPAGDARIIGYFTGIILMIGFTVTYGHALIARSIKLFVVSMVIFASIVLANWRLLWLFAFFLPFYVPYLLSKKPNILFGRLLVTLPTLAILVGLVTYLVKIFSPNVYDLILNRVLTNVLNFDITGDARYWAWKSAILKFQESPFIGHGLGREFDFLGLNSLGQYVVFNLGTHNVILDLLYQVGVLGVWIFIFLHVFVIIYVLKRLFSITVGQRLIVGALLFGYAGVLGASMVQSALREPTDAVVFYLILGFLVQYTLSFQRSEHVTG